MRFLFEKFSLVSTAHAQEHSAIDITPLLLRINEFILNPLILLLFVLALVMFMWGIIEFLSGQDNEEAREKGKRNMFWGVIGMVIMFSVYGIIYTLLATFGIQEPDLMM